MSASKDELSGTGNEKMDPWLPMVVMPAFSGCFRWKTDGPHEVEIVDYH